MSKGLERIVLAAFAGCGLAVGMGCICPDQPFTARVTSTNLADLAGARITLDGDRFELTYTRGADAGWTAVFRVASTAPLDPGETGDSRDSGDSGR